LHVSGDSEKFGRVWLPAGKTSLGRKDCVACIGNDGDKSISRKHAEVEVGLLESWEMGDVRTRPSIAVSDSSKFGTFYLRPPQAAMAYDHDEDTSESEEDDGVASPGGEAGEGLEDGVAGESGSPRGVCRGVSGAGAGVVLRTPRAAREGEEATSCADGWGEKDYVAVARQPAVSRPDRAESQPTALREGDRIKFGVHRAVYELRWRPLVLCCSTVPAGEQDEVFAAARELTAHVVPEWGSRCTHLVMPPGTAQVTSKALLALADGRPIVSLAWLQDAIEAVGPQGSRLPATFPRYAVHLQSRYLGLDAPTQVRPHRDTFEDHHGFKRLDVHGGGRLGDIATMMLEVDDQEEGTGLPLLAQSRARSELLRDVVIIFYPSTCYLDSKGASRNQTMSIARRAGASAVVALDNARQVNRLCAELEKLAEREGAGAESSEDRVEDVEGGGATILSHAWLLRSRVLAIDGDVEGFEARGLECLGDTLGGALLRARKGVEGCTLRAFFMAVLHNDSECLDPRELPLGVTGASDKCVPEKSGLLPSSTGRKRYSGEAFAGDAIHDALADASRAAAGRCAPAAETPHPPPSRRVRRSSADPSDAAETLPGDTGGYENVDNEADPQNQNSAPPPSRLMHQKSLALTGPSGVADGFVGDDVGGKDGDGDGDGVEMPEGWVSRSPRVNCDDVDVAADLEVVPREAQARLSAEYTRRNRQPEKVAAPPTVVSLRDMDEAEEKRLVSQALRDTVGGAWDRDGGVEGDALWEAENVPVTVVAQLHADEGEEEEDGEGEDVGELYTCDEAEVVRLPVTELKAVLKRCRLPVSGTKTALVARVVQCCLQDAKGRFRPRNQSISG